MVGKPLRETIAATTDFLGQFSAVDTVELTAQVGGTLTETAFRDGQIVQKGDLRALNVLLDTPIAYIWCFGQGSAELPFLTFMEKMKGSLG
jgi:hypothetical protein